MKSWTHAVSAIGQYLPFLVVTAGLALFLWLLHWLLIGRRPELGRERKLPRQIILLVTSLTALIIAVLTLPVRDTLQQQIIGIIGLLISGILAFSSTTVVANMMAGMLLRFTQPFRIGDFIRVESYFGRVTERGLFDTEIQAETRELISIPNTFLISHPISTTRSSGTIISITLSLGYDTHHGVIEPLLVKAAAKSGLEDPFVHIVELGNFSVSYRISGFLADIKWLITARSDLAASVLDVLHREGIEIMSPAFMGQRPLQPNQVLIPPNITPAGSPPKTVAEEVAFDKADMAQQLQLERKALSDLLAQLEASVKEASEDEKTRLQIRIEEVRTRLTELQNPEVTETS